MQRAQLAAWPVAARLITAVLAACTSVSALAAEVPGKAADPPFAIVAGTLITAGEYDAAYAVAQRQRFYHRQVPEGERTALRREVGDNLINRVLLMAEAKRRGLGPDKAKVQAQLAQYSERYRTSPQWAKIQAEAMPALARELERQSTLERLEASVKSAAAPDDATLREYYASRPDRFTEPEQVKLSLILLKVDPSSPKLAWQKAQEEAAAIRARIARGADFGSLARLHSTDSSAERGGDMGYLHRGMMPEGLHEQIDKLKTAALSEPIRLLEGYAILRIDDRKPAQLRRYEDVRERAQQLWQREEGERRWNALIAELRGRATIQVVDASRYPAAVATGQP